jgi:hypothetical protein
MVNEMEIWKDIPEYEGFYQVSTHGRVRHIPSGNILKPFKVGKHPRYDAVQLLRKSKRLHRLVASAFIPNPDNLPEVNHIDGVKTNNHVNNLEWVTTKDNIAHALKNGLMATGERSVFSKLTEEQVREIRSSYKPNTRGFGCKSLAKKYGVSDTTIRNILKGKKWKYEGY